MGTDRTTEFDCPNCAGSGALGAYRSGPRVCVPCKGTGRRLCACGVLAEHHVDREHAGGTFVCSACWIIETGCAYCVIGDPVAFHDGRPCCEKCLSALHEAGEARDTQRCAAPEGCHDAA